MNKERKNEKGFTMVELIIVVAIMGVIGALLVPAYGKMTTKARITTDISTVKTLSRTAASYKAEQGGTDPVDDGDDQLEELNDELVLKGYLDQGAALQCSGATLTVEDGTKYTLNVDGCDDAITDVIDEMVEANADLGGWVEGYESEGEGEGGGE